MTSKAGMNSSRTVYYLLGTWISHSNMKTSLWIVLVHQFSIPTCMGKNKWQEADIKPKCLLRVRWDDTVCVQHRGGGQYLHIPMKPPITLSLCHRHHHHCQGDYWQYLPGKPFVIECLAVRRNQSGQLSIVWKLHVFMFLQPTDNLLSRNLVTFEFDDDVMCQAWYVLSTGL